MTNFVKIKKVLILLLSVFLLFLSIYFVIIPFGLNSSLSLNSINRNYFFNILLNNNLKVCLFLNLLKDYDLINSKFDYELEYEMCK